MKAKIQFLFVFALLLRTSTLSAQIVSGMNDINRSNSIQVRLEALPLCNEDFENYRYNHFLSPEGYIDIKEEITLPYFSLYGQKGKVKSLLVNTYKFYEEFGEKKKVMKAYNKADFDVYGKITDLDYKPQLNGGYKSYNTFKIVGDGNLKNLETEYDEDGRVCRRYFTSNKQAYMDYNYDDKGRVVKITFDTGNYSNDGDNITTVKYNYDTRQGHENYITGIESFIGTEKREEANISYSSNDLRLEKVVIKKLWNLTERRWEYKYNENGQFSQINISSYSCGNCLQKLRTYFEYKWELEEKLLHCNYRDVQIDNNDDEKELRNEVYIFTFDDYGNWTQLETKFNVFERKIEYFTEIEDTIVSEALCADCSKPLINNTAFCEHCGSEQAVILALQQWEKRQEEKRRVDEKQQIDEASNAKTNINDLTNNNVTGDGSEADNSLLILTIVCVLALIGMFFYKLKRKQKSN